MSKRDSSNQKSKVAKGKLVDKYRNKISFLREAKINVTSDVIPEAATCMSSEAHQGTDTSCSDTLMFLVVSGFYVYYFYVSLTIFRKQ